MAAARVGTGGAQGELGASCSVTTHEEPNKHKNGGMSKGLRSQSEQASDGQSWKIGAMN